MHPQIEGALTSSFEVEKSRVTRHGQFSACKEAFLGLLYMDINY
jgi:hypothetical protein